MAPMSAVLLADVVTEPIHARDVAALVAGSAGGGHGAAPAAPAAKPLLPQLRIYIPGGAGGGWDQTGRTMEQVMRAAGIMQNFQFENVPGAGGAVGPVG